MNNYWIIFWFLIFTIIIGTGDANASNDGWTAWGGAATYHFDRDLKTKDGRDLNERNLMLGVDYKGWTALYFNNSYYNDTYALGYNYHSNTDFVKIGMMWGMMKGYEDWQISTAHLGDWDLLVMPYLRIDMGVINPTIMIAPDFVSLGVGVDF